MEPEISAVSPWSFARDRRRRPRRHARFTRARSRRQAPATTALCGNLAVDTEVPFDLSDPSLQCVDFYGEALYVSDLRIEMLEPAVHTAQFVVQRFEFKRDEARNQLDQARVHTIPSGHLLLDLADRGDDVCEHLVRRVAV